MIGEKEIEKMCDVFTRPTHYEARDWFQAMNTFRLAYNYGYRLIKPCLNVISRDDLLEHALYVPIAPLKIGEETHCEYVVFVDDIQKMPETMPLTKDCEEGNKAEAERKTGHCKGCKYFEYDSVAKVDKIPLIVAHEICKRWGDGCKTSEDGYCFLYEPREKEGDDGKRDPC